MRRYNVQIGLDCCCSTLLRLGKYCSLCQIVRDMELRHKKDERCSDFLYSPENKRRWNYSSCTVSSIHCRQLFQLRLNHFPLRWGGGGRGLDAMGTQPIAAARAKGNQAATDAIFHFGSFNFQFYLANCGPADRLTVIVAVFSSADQFQIFNIAFPRTWQTALTW